MTSTIAPNPPLGTVDASSLVWPPAPGLTPVALAVDAANETFDALTSDDLAAIGRTIDLGGLAAVADDVVASVVAQSLRLGVRPVATAILASPAEPTVARERAFGLVAVSLARAGAA